MIPKTIHYCWFGGGGKSSLAKRCIASWRKFFPDYEIIEWNEENYDVHKIPFISEAYVARKYAFVSDYARFDILYTKGGVYFDTDVEVIRPLDDIIAQGAFMGFERDPDFTEVPGLLPAEASARLAANPGLGLACAPGLGLYKKVLEMYEGLHFLNADGTYNLVTVVQYVTRLLMQSGLSFSDSFGFCEGIKIYPSEYFNPKDMESGRIIITPNTRTIHHYTASWYSPKQRIVMWVIRHMGVPVGRVIGLFLRNPLKVPKRVWDYWRYKR